VPYHEVAHQWWGNLVVWHSYRDQWICEGLANYVSLLFADSRKDSDHALNVWLDRYRNSLVSRLPGKENDIDFSGPLTLGYRLNSSVNPNGYEEIVYAKATWVFHMLRMMLREPLAKDPDGRFAALLRGIAESHHDAALTTDDLQSAVEKAMLPSMDLEGGHSMAWFFDQYVRGTGIPTYKVDFTVQHAGTGEQYVVKGVLHQSGVPQDFLARVPLYVSYPGGKPILLGHVTTSGADTSFRFTTHVSPRHVLVDPELTLLCVTDLTSEREQVH
jgi:aminopeptidase N